MRPEPPKYKVERVAKDFNMGYVYIAYVSRHAKRHVSWSEIGRADTKEGAVALCEEWNKPKEGPWFFSPEGNSGKFLKEVKYGSTSKS